MSNLFNILIAGLALFLLLKRFGLFNFNKKKIQEFINNKSVIIDVRSAGEFSNGSIKGAINIPVDSLHSKLSTFKKDQYMMVFCASGMRSSMAKSILVKNGFKNVLNAGTYSSLKKIIA